MDALLTGMAGLGELFSDFNFLLKVFVLMTIVSFVRNHLGNSPLSIAIIAGISFFVFFDLWALFGGIYLLWMLLAGGIAGLFVDIAFAWQSHGPHVQQQMEEAQAAAAGEGPDISGKEVLERGRGRHAAGHRPAIRPPMI